MPDSPDHGCFCLISLLFFILFSDMSLFEYLKMELTQGYILEHDEAKFSEKRRRVYTFMTIPKELEKVKHASADWPLGDVAVVLN